MVTQFGFEFHFIGCRIITFWEFPRLCAVGDVSVAVEILRESYARTDILTASYTAAKQSLGVDAEITGIGHSPFLP